MTPKEQIAANNERLRALRAELATLRLQAAAVRNCRCVLVKISKQGSK